jgi:hypothetical protein
MSIRIYWIFSCIGLCFGIVGIALLVQYGNSIPHSLTPQEQMDLRAQGVTPQQMSEAIEQKRLHSEAFRNTMIGVGFFGGCIVIACGMLATAQCFPCEDAAEVAPAPAAAPAVPPP